MNTLAIDTSSETISIALRADHKILSVSLKIGLKHSETLLPWIDRLFREAGIDVPSLSLVVCSIGPGSFTGLRIGLSTAKGIVMGSESALVGVSTLDYLAGRFDFFKGTVAPVINAKKNRFYTAFYNGDKRLTDYLDVTAADFFINFEKLQEVCQSEQKYRKYQSRLLLTGPDCDIIYRYLKDNLQHENTAMDRGFRFADAYTLLNIGEKRFKEAGGDNPAALAPLYIRKSEAEIKMFGE